MGLIYLLHFERSNRHHTRHYLGYTENLDARLQAHRAGRGSPLVAAAVRDGIDFQLAATWPGDRHQERHLDRYNNTPRRLCPICRSQPPGAPALKAVPAVEDRGDEALLDALSELAEPVTLTALAHHLDRRGVPRVGSAHGRLELLALAGRVRKASVLGEIAWQAHAG